MKLQSILLSVLLVGTSAECLATESKPSAREVYLNYLSKVASTVQLHYTHSGSGSVKVELRITPKGSVESVVPTTSCPEALKQEVIRAIRNSEPLGPTPFSDIAPVTVGVCLNFNGSSISLDESVRFIPSRLANFLQANGSNLTKTGNVQQGLKQLLLAAELAPSRSIYEQLSEAYLKIGQSKSNPQAIVDFEQSVYCNPSNRAARLYLDAGLIDIGKDPTSAAVRYKMYQERLASGNKRCAIAELIEAQRITPKAEWKSEIERLQVAELPAVMREQPGHRSYGNLKSPYHDWEELMTSGTAKLADNDFERAADDFHRAAMAVPYTNTSSLLKAHTPEETYRLNLATTAEASSLRLASVHLENAVALLEQVLESNQTQKKEDSLLQAFALFELGLLQLKRGDSAMNSLARAVECLSKRDVSMILELGVMKNSLACAQISQQKNAEDALNSIAGTQYLRRWYLGEQHPAVANGWPVTHLPERFSDEILPRARADFEAVENSLQGMSPDAPAVINISEYAKVLMADRQFTTAIRLLNRSLELKLGLTKEKSETAIILDDLCALGACNNTIQNYADATKNYELAMKIVGSTGSMRPFLTERALLLDALALNAERAGDNNKSEQLLKSALEFREKRFCANHPDIATAQISLANFYIRAGRLNQAKPLLESADKIRANLFGRYWTGFPDFDDYCKRVKQSWLQVPQEKNDSKS